MNKKDWQIAAILLVVSAAICTLIWYANEGRADRPPPSLAVATPLPALLPPSQATSAIVTTPAGFQVVVPGSLQEPIWMMKSTKKMRVTLEFEEKNSEQVKALFVKGGTYYVTVVK